MNFLAELKRRNVIRTAGLYLVGAWLLVQVASTVLPALRTLIIVLAMDVRGRSAQAIHMLTCDAHEKRWPKCLS